MAETITIKGVDINVVIKQVREIAAEFPDFVYQPKQLPVLLTPEQQEQAMMGSPEAPTTTNGCVYREADGRAGCIVGQALNMLGVLALVSDNQNLRGVRGLVDDTHPNSWRDPRVKWLRQVQNHQDRRVSWGQAVRLADQYIPLGAA